ncbi:hypothetical protein SAMN04487906_2291 [Zhouia amylolytica]|uniref:Membrane metalloprotease n=2 Tax=Zhouia amylolytica TaxID=376730 RepID=W2URL2_9FLAO|nr:membrane metalloprotease [Zhouia amylolytica]ETN96780.1 hypothetical protein P278_02060 [Zhouia amylolytica AD3]MCQ0111132.1 membrane metalloprotease [Zhouia amylolytica]SFS95140.1 hypothetical protein SAMN04487906_2291 [Zhouia amylolytica]
MKKALYLLLSLYIFIGCSNDSSTNDEDIKRANRQTTGASANDFLSDDNFNSLTIELIYVTGYRPNQSSIDNLESFIQERTYKPGGINFVERAIASPANSPYTIQEIADLENDYREEYNMGDNLTLSIMFIDGKSDQDEGNSVVLGTAYRNTSMVIYQNTLEQNSNGVGEPDRVMLESTVLRHELSHLFGLVDLGTPMLQDHKDEANGHHCDVQDCLMNYQVEAGSVFDMASGGTIPSLDPLCLADLKANGGK